MHELQSLVYVSSATRNVTAESLRHLLERAQARNRMHAVTGVLLFDAGNFMQYLEAPPEGLAVVYKFIQRDRAHTGIIEIANEPISHRVFGEWAMGARVMNAPEFSDVWLTERGVEARIANLSPAPNAAAALLHGFWQRGQHRPS